MIDWLSVYQMTSPASTAEIPRVTISELTPTLATVVPLTNPTSEPRAMPTATARTRGTPSRAMNPATSTCESPATGPTEKSNSPPTSGIMIASESTPTTAWLPRTFLKLAAVRKVADVSLHKLKNRITPTKAMTRA